MKKFLFVIYTIFSPTIAFANQPKEWQLGFQEAASQSMRNKVLKKFALFEKLDEESKKEQS